MRNKSENKSKLILEYQWFIYFFTSKKVKTKTEKMSDWTKNIYPELMQIIQNNEPPNLAFVPVLLYWAGGIVNHFEQSIKLQERIKANLKKVGIEI